MMDSVVFAAPGLWIQQLEAIEGGPDWYAYSQGVGQYFHSEQELVKQFDRSDVRQWLTQVNGPEPSVA